MKQCKKVAVLERIKRFVAALNTLTNYLLVAKSVTRVKSSSGYFFSNLGGTTDFHIIRPCFRGMYGVFFIGRFSFLERQLLFWRVSL